MEELAFEVDGYSWRIEHITKTADANRTSFNIVCVLFNTEDATAPVADKISIGDTIILNNYALSIVSLQTVYKTHKQLPTTLSIFALPPATVEKFKKQNEMKQRLPELMEKAAKHIDDH